MKDHMNQAMRAASLRPAGRERTSMHRSRASRWGWATLAAVSALLTARRPGAVPVLLRAAAERTRRHCAHRSGGTGPDRGGCRASPRRALSLERDLGAGGGAGSYRRADDGGRRGANGRRLVSVPGRGDVGANRSDADYVRAIRHGVSSEGRGLLIMHSDAYHNLSAEDLGRSSPSSSPCRRWTTSKPTPGLRR